MKLFSALFLLGVTLALVAGHPYNFPQNGNSDQPQDHSFTDGSDQESFPAYQPEVQEGSQSEIDQTKDHSFTFGSDHEVPQESGFQSEPDFGSQSETYQPQSFGNRQGSFDHFFPTDERQNSAPIPIAMRDHGIPAHFDSVDEEEASLNETESDQDEKSMFDSHSETFQPQSFGNNQKGSPQFTRYEVRHDSAPIPIAMRDHETPAHFDSVDEGEASLNETESDQDEESKFDSHSETFQPQSFGNRQRRFDRFFQPDRRQDSAPSPTAIEDHGIRAHFDAIAEEEASLNETELDRSESNETLPEIDERDSNTFMDFINDLIDPKNDSDKEDATNSRMDETEDTTPVSTDKGEIETPVKLFESETRLEEEMEDGDSTDNPNVQVGETAGTSEDTDVPDVNETPADEGTAAPFALPTFFHQRFSPQEDVRSPPQSNVGNFHSQNHPRIVKRHQRYNDETWTIHEGGNVLVFHAFPDSRDSYSSGHSNERFDPHSWY